WMLFLDELTSATPPVQAAAYKLILDKMVGNKKLHPACFIVGAGNLESDNAVVPPMSTALKSRMTHLILKMDVPEWLSWAMDNGIDHRITDY
ncbi:MoxR family ATPase, partial [Staphylococcus epidermidis]